MKVVREPDRKWFAGIDPRVGRVHFWRRADEADVERHGDWIADLWVAFCGQVRLPHESPGYLIGHPSALRCETCALCAPERRVSRAVPA